jgi:hypothetical protein
VSVGFSATYPDLCLVTLSVPGVIAEQFLESTNLATTTGSYSPIGHVDSPDNLPASVTHWNAGIDAQGMLVLNE